MAEKPLTDSINALTTYINSVTGGEDTNLSDAISTLAEGYGVGGYNIDDIASGKEPSGNVVIDAKTVGQQFFNYRNNLESVMFESTETIGIASFYSCANLTSINGKNLKSIGVKAFMNCTKLGDVKLPKVQILDNEVFNNCPKLKTIYLPSCISIGYNCFAGDRYLSNIYLPNDASTYTRAPWGATNATIHYNTVFDENGEPIIE